MSSTTRLVKTICQLTYDARDYALLNSSINTLSKKHGQLKSAVQAMVELTIEWLDEIKERDGVEKWLELVETLRTITEGKVYRPAFLLHPRVRISVCLDLPGNTASTSDAPPLKIPRTTRRLVRCQNPERVSTNSLRSSFRPASRDLLLDGTKRKDGVHSRADATVDCCG